MQNVVRWLALLVVFTIPWENVAEFSSVGRISRVAGLALAVTWAAAVAVRGEVRRPRLFHALALVFVLWNAVSLLWTVDPQASVARVSTFLQLLVLVYVLWDTLRSAPALDAALQAYVLGAWVTVLSLIGDYLSLGPIGYQDRFSTGTFQLDDLSLILALGIPSAWYLAAYARSGRVIRWLRAVNFAYVPAGAVAIMLTGSRAALVSVTASLVYIVVSLFRLRRAVGTLALGMLALLFFALQPLVPRQTLERLGTTGTEVAEGDLEGRVPIWREALVTFRDHPLLGVGSGAFRSADSGKVAHNFVMRSLAELGLVGFALFAGLLAVTAAYVPGQPTGLAGLWSSVLATWLVGASLYNFENKKQTWLFFILVVLGRSLPPAPREGRSPRPITPAVVPADRGPGPPALSTPGPGESGRATGIYGAGDP